MKQTIHGFSIARLLFCACLVTAAFAAGTTTSQAALILATDNAGNYSSWGSGMNLGTGWGGGWTFRNGGNTVQTNPGGSFFGAFIGNSINNNSAGDSNGDGDINTSNKAWGMYANTSNELYAVRPFAQPLQVGHTVKWEMDNGNIDSTRVVGLRFLSNANDINTRVFEARFVGGDSNYTLIANPNVTTGIGFTREGLSFEYTLTGASSYSLKITRKVNGATQTITGSNANASAITALAFRNLAAGTGSDKDGFFNSISIERPNSAPTVNDHEIFNVLGGDPGNNPILHTFTANDPDPEDATLTWTNFQFDSYTAAYGGAGPGPAINALFNPGTREFSWDTTGSPRGIYRWRVDASDPQFTDTGYLTVHVTEVPEPGAAILVGAILLGLLVQHAGRVSRKQCGS